MTKSLNTEYLTQETKKLLSKLGDSDISPSAYDTAWVARIQDKSDPRKSMLFQFLIKFTFFKKNNAEFDDILSSKA